MCARRCAMAARDTKLRAGRAADDDDGQRCSRGAQSGDDGDVRELLRTSLHLLCEPLRWAEPQCGEA